MMYPNAPPGVVGSGTIPEPSGAGGMYHEYRVTITPHTKPADFDLKISVKRSVITGEPPLLYSPVDVGAKPNGREELRLRVKGAARNLDGRVSGHFTERHDNPRWRLLGCR